MTIAASQESRQEALWSDSQTVSRIRKRKHKTQELQGSTRPGGHAVGGLGMPSHQGADSRVILITNAGNTGKWP